MKQKYPYIAIDKGGDIAILYMYSENKFGSSEYGYFYSKLEHRMIHHIYSLVVRDGKIHKVNENFSKI